MVIGGEDADTSHGVSPPVASVDSSVSARNRDYQKVQSTERG